MTPQQWQEWFNKPKVETPKVASIDELQKEINKI